MTGSNGQFAFQGAVVGEIRFDGVHGPQDCNGTFSIDVSTGFEPEMLNSGHLVSAGKWFRVDQVFEVKQESDHYLVRCHAERDLPAEH